MYYDKKGRFSYMRGDNFLEYYYTNEGNIDKIRFGSIYDRIISLIYDWNTSSGLLNSKSIHEYGSTQKSESFNYDNLQRLESWSVNEQINGHLINTANYSMSYDANGNINSKSDIGEYSYFYEKPHAVRNISNNNSEAIQGKQNILTYTSFNKISTAIVIDTNNTKGESDHYNVIYGPDNQRRISYLNGEQTIYCGLYEKRSNGDALHYIKTPWGIGGVVISHANGSDDFYILVNDYLGSLVAVLDENYSVVKEFSYDPWGQRRNPNDYTDFNVDNETTFTRGFTGHEHIPGFNLINMNGRIYDPSIARILSPDNYIQAPDFTQNYNRYSYCLNNPLKYTDPTGEKWDWRHWGLLADILTGGGVITGAIAAGATVFPTVAGHIVPQTTEPGSAAIGSWFGGAFSEWFGGGNFNDGLVEGDRRAHNSWEISGGMFAYDDGSETSWDMQIMSRLTIQQPMTSIGMGLSQLINMTSTTDVESFYGSTVVLNNYANESEAMSIGGYIYMNPNTQGGVSLDNAMLLHEYGHFLQTRDWGGQAYISGAFASILSTFGMRSVGDHSEIWVEQDANARAWDRFGSSMGPTAYSKFTTGRYSSQKYYDSRFLRGYLFNDLFLTLLYDIIWSN